MADMTDKLDPLSHLAFCDKRPEHCFVRTRTQDNKMYIFRKMHESTYYVIHRILVHEARRRNKKNVILLFTETILYFTNTRLGYFF